MKASQFSKNVIHLVANKQMTYLEAIAETCEASGVDFTDVKPLLTSVVMEHLTAELQDDHLLPQTAKLPF